MNTLALTKLHFTLTFTRETRLPQFVGNTIRGALGQALHDDHQEVYDAVFKVADDGSVPNPFAVSAPYPSQGGYAAGETLGFSVTLFGTACGHADEMIEAAESMCKGKLATARLADAECVYSREWSDAYAETIPYCDTLTLDFASPTVLLSSREAVYEPDFPAFIDSLFGRISAVIDNHGENEFVLPYSLIARKPLVRATHDIKRVHINSNNHPIDGFVGRISYHGDVTRYLPYIDLGGQLHLGKKTTRSCGEYTFEI
jgi:hypothetical protein